MASSSMMQMPSSTFRPAAGYYEHAPQQTVTYSQQFKTATQLDTALYKPEGAEYVAPGNALRGGMYPLYDMAEVRTFEAFPVFQSNPATTTMTVVDRAVAPSEHAPSVHQKSVRGPEAPARPPHNKKRGLCC